MERFIDVHTVKGITAEQLAKAHRLDVEQQAKEHVTFMQAWADPISGKVFCLSEGPDKASVRRVHEKAGHVTDEIYEVPLTAK
jgi:hypothetical protein